MATFFPGGSPGGPPRVSGGGMDRAAFYRQLFGQGRGKAVGHGLSMQQFQNLEAGRAPGGFHGIFGGMSANFYRTLAQHLMQTQGAPPAAGGPTDVPPSQSPLFQFQGFNHVNPDYQALPPSAYQPGPGGGDQQYQNGNGIIPRPPIPLGQMRNHLVSIAARKHRYAGAQPPRPLY